MWPIQLIIKSPDLNDLKRIGLFNRFFSDVVEKENMYFIESNQLVSQCIIARTEEPNNFLFRNTPLTMNMRNINID